LLTYFPRWTEDSVPLDEDSVPITDWKSRLWQVFWVFHAMVDNLGHLDLMSDVTTGSQLRAAQVRQILEKVMPVASVWLEENGLLDLAWCFSDFILLFKRSFTDIWRTWIMFNVSKDPKQWLIYFSAAIFMLAFEIIASLPDTSMTSVMDQFSSIIDGLGVERLGKMALWIYGHVNADPTFKLVESVEVQTDIVPFVSVSDYFGVTAE
jgi:hypothetical protein